MPFTSGTPSESLYVTQIRFCRALAVVRSLPAETEGLFQPSLADKMYFYGLYKQTIAGDCTLKRPNPNQALLYAKWKAWDSMRGKSPIDAQIMYIHALVELLEEFLERNPYSDLVDSLNESLVYLVEAENDEYQETWDADDQDYTQQEQFPSAQSTSSTIELPLTPQPFYYTHGHLRNDHPHSLYKDTFGQKSNISISTLQSEITALCREMSSLQITNSKSIFQWQWLWLLKSVAKHAIFNCLSSVLLFLVLWRRKSPIAYAVISYVGPRLRNILQYLMSHIIA
ncbi:unnamed protein product [Mucor circinelloides]|uniref:ACB domain-containing protein n=1 Tax=Mucor circinelloides f. circinelloides (strain 1006PhL) TaxID=1220926 RepID=S2JXC0_MUCC1|nr:hypothetical protein HMPREF1544_08784 [Mucor circinelloides 1006PhL]